MEFYEQYKFSRIEKKYNINFEDKILLVKAFTHGSFNNLSLGNYQRLEFLGDAVLQMVVSDYMYRFNSYQNEGEMSKERGALVSEFSLAYIMRQEQLEKFILFGRSVKRSEIGNSDSYIADVYEAFVAAIYLDQGYNCAEKFIKETLISRIDEILSHDDLKDYKTELQEELQVNGAIDIKYECETLEESFKANVLLEGIKIGTGIGKTKKKAEQQAAKDALLNRI